MAIPHNCSAYHSDIRSPVDFEVRVDDTAKFLRGKCSSSYETPIRLTRTHKNISSWHTNGVRNRPEACLDVFRNISVRDNLRSGILSADNRGSKRLGFGYVKGKPNRLNKHVQVW